MEIERYFPSVVGETVEFKKIAEAENPLFDDLWRNLEYTLEEMFLDTMSEQGISRFEKILDIIPENNEIEQRRSIIIALLFNRPPYTLNFLREKAKAYFGEETTVDVDYNNYTVYIRADKNYNENRKVFKIFLRKILPANIIDYLIQFIKTSSELNIRLNLGAGIYMNLPPGVRENCGSMGLKSNLGRSKFTFISLGIPENYSSISLKSNLGRNKFTCIPLAVSENYSGISLKSNLGRNKFTFIPQTFTNDNQGG